MATKQTQVTPAADEKTLSPAERIEASYRQFVERNGLPPSMPIPARRQLAVGDRVEYGKHPEPKVVAVHDGGAVVSISYEGTRHNYGRVIPTGTAYVTLPWFSVIPVKHQQESDLTSAATIQSQHLRFSQSLLWAVINRILSGDAVASSEYQRDYVWSDEDKDRYLDSVFTGREIGRFVFVRRTHPDKDQVLDGKQRLSALTELLLGYRSYKGLFWDQMSSQDRNYVANRTAQVCEVCERTLGRSGLLQLFLNLNAAGVPQTEQHLQHVRDLLAESQA